ncbi:MAG: NAD-dependent protein deacylase, partial [Treponema sp.]|nr:NAD-dependent protein deacylase [Treponema sp.]
MIDSVTILQQLINKSKKIAFFGGAGVSTESGIPDFRSIDGLYQQKWKYPPEQIISHSFFEYDPVEFYRFYREKLVPSKEIKPNAAHYKLAELEEKGKLLGVITQNIDGLHQKAGSKKVFELHGSTLRNYCTKCGEFYDEQFILQSENAPDKLPHCTKCGGIVKPDVVLYEEGHILLYSKSISFNLGRLPLSEKAKAEYRYSDAKGLFRRSILLDNT